MPRAALFFEPLHLFICEKILILCWPATSRRHFLELVKNFAVQSFRAFEDHQAAITRPIRVQVDDALNTMQMSPERRSVMTSLAMSSFDPFG